MRDLDLQHVECDEIWTFVKIKDRHIAEEQKSNTTIGSQYVFIALHDETRLVPAYYVGKRDFHSTFKFMENLRQCVDIPKPPPKDDLRYNLMPYKPVIRISTDAWESYEGAIDQVFGPFAEHGELKKVYEGNYVKGTEPHVISGDFDEELVTTSLVERHNLTIRTLIRRFNRQSLCFSKKLEALKAAIPAYLAFYNYTWIHRTLKTSPAHAIGIVNRLWTFRDLYDHVMAA